MSDYLDPKWDDAGRIHDWRNHVPEFVRAKWEYLSPDVRKLMYEWADELALAETWE